MDAAQDWLALLLSDSAFPGGALANSQGLESAVLHGAVNKDDFQSLLTFINLSLEQAVQSTLPFVKTAYHFGDVAMVRTATNVKSTTLKVVHNKWHNLDKYEHAFRSNEISRRASINQGKCFLRVIRHAFPSVDTYLLNMDVGLTEGPKNVNSQMHMHFAPIFGIVCKYLGLSMKLCVKVYLRMLLRDLVSAAIRLGLLGPLDGVKLQVDAFPVVEALLQQYDSDNDCVNCNGSNASESNKSVDDRTTHCSVGSMDVASTNPSVCYRSSVVQFYRNIKPVQTAPILDLLQSRHDMLYSRLFSS